MSSIREYREALEQYVEAADWYRRCLEDLNDRRPVRGLAEARAGYDSALIKVQDLLEPKSKTEPVYDKAEYAFTATVWEEFSDDTLERIVEDFRAFAFPKVWGYYTAPDRRGRIFRCDFEIEGREREVGEYLNEVRNLMLTWFPNGYEIERVDDAR